MCEWNFLSVVQFYCLVVIKCHYVATTGIAKGEVVLLPGLLQDSFYVAEATSFRS